MNTSNLKHIFVIAFISIFSFSILVQDLIVTIEGDSLNCVITNLEPGKIYFTFKYKNEIRSTILPLGQVKSRQFNYYPTSEVPADKVVGYENYPPFRAAIYGGWSYRVAKLADNINSYSEQYIQDLRPGYHYGLDLSCYLSESLGFGFQYTEFRSKNASDDAIIILPNGSKQKVQVRDDITINFIGPLFCTRLFNANKKNSLLLNFGMGYMGYTDEAFFINDFTIKGGTVGLCLDIGYDIGLSETFALGFKLSFLNGILDQFDLSYGMVSETVILEEGYYEGLSRIDLSIGLRINK